MNNLDDEEDEWLSKTDKCFIEDFKKEFSSPVQNLKKCTCFRNNLIVTPDKDCKYCLNCGGEL
jgi:hypothetical protein